MSQQKKQKGLETMSTEASLMASPRENESNTSKKD
jgi:hypothetical protein